MVTTRPFPPRRTSRAPSPSLTPAFRRVPVELKLWSPVPARLSAARTRPHRHTPSRTAWPRQLVPPMKLWRRAHGRSSDRPILGRPHGTNTEPWLPRPGHRDTPAWCGRTPNRRRWTTRSAARKLSDILAPTIYSPKPAKFPCCRVRKDKGRNLSVAIAATDPVSCRPCRLGKIVKRRRDHGVSQGGGSLIDDGLCATMAVGATRFTALECLEGRQLLSVYTGPSTVRRVQSSGGTFSIAVSGPGAIKENFAGRSGIDLSAFGTTSATTITITQIRPRWHFPSQYLGLSKVKITSGQLGGLDAGFCELNGKMTPLNNTMSTLELGTMAPRLRSMSTATWGQ